MTCTSKLSILFFAALWSLSVLADGDHAAPKRDTKSDENSAVSAFDPAEGFKLKDSALTALGVRFKKIDSSSPWSVPKSALVQIKHTTGVYRRFEGWISFVLVESKAKDKGIATIASEDLQAGDEIAIEGASFLRMTEADLNSDTVDSCSH